MILSQNMFNMLQEVLRTEPLENAVPLDVPNNELGYQLIKLYYRVEKQRNRALITEIMEEAGGTWLDKLLDKENLPDNTGSTAPPKMTSLDDFMSLLAENDDFERSIQF